jgi:hypothetical protein
MLGPVSGRLIEDAANNTDSHWERREYPASI